MIKAVLFDVDGVLIDSFEGNLKYFNHVIGKFGGKPLSAEEYRNLYFSTSKKVFSYAFPKKTETEIEEIISYGLTVIEGFFKDSKLFPHTEETLGILKKSCRLGIVTNRLAATMKILDFFSIGKYFDAIISFSDVKNHKPHPEPVQLALRKLEASQGEALYVGDAATDLEAGSQAGVKVIMYRNPSVRGDYNINDMREILGIVEKLNRQS